ncbi:hypothetical protein Bealeia1_02011 (plasmid) [Candidatus Bealeia paramacronuclearis]|uniref:Uncharacterized protein n=1 Tax=Candidatus Bealeia paramacronuclearis TaxID=1921001 RepID=A0ABZ2C6M5_9PROT
MMTPQMLMLLQGGGLQGGDHLQGVGALGNIPSQPARDVQGFGGVGSLYDGAREGMRSVRDLTSISEDDQRQSMGMGLMRLFSGMSNRLWLRNPGHAGRAFSKYS